MNSREHIQQIIDKHSIKAQQSSYDSDTGVLAILSVREALMTIPENITGDEYLQVVLKKVNELFSNFSDPDGQYTLGHSVIGSLLDDIHSFSQGVNDE